jgi:flagellar basal-body rod protein FlgB
MLGAMFQTGAIPLLEQLVHFAQARHTVLAGNIANLDTPGYQVRDLSVEDFQSRLREAIAESRQPPRIPSPGEPSTPPAVRMAEVVRNPKTILHHDQNNVGLEHQVAEMVKNQMQHNLALTILGQQFRLLQTAINGRL